MPFAGFGYPSDVLAQRIRLKLPVDQWFLRALAACGRFAASIIRYGIANYPPRGAAAPAPNLDLS